MKSFHTYKKQGVDYKISEERKDMADNRKMRNAKAVKNDEFCISSNWKLNSFKLDESNSICNRETSGLLKEVFSDDKN